MHSSYNYSGFVDLYTSLYRQQASQACAASVKRPGQSVLAETHTRPAAQPAGAAYRQRLRLVPR
jgi:hypothetical protein